MNNQQNTEKLRSSCAGAAWTSQQSTRGKFRRSWLEAEQEGGGRQGVGGGGDPETGGDGQAARLEEDPQNPQRRILRFSFVF